MAPGRDAFASRAMPVNPYHLLIVYWRSAFAGWARSLYRFCCYGYCALTSRAFDQFLGLSLILTGVC
jgi:hypothetical protein